MKNTYKLVNVSLQQDNVKKDNDKGAIIITLYLMYILVNILAISGQCLFYRHCVMCLSHPAMMVPTAEKNHSAELNPSIATPWNRSKPSCTQ